MRKLIGLLMLVCAGSVNAATLTFEEVGVGPSVTAFAEVGAFSFTSSQGGVAIWDAVDGGRPYLASSPDNAVYMQYVFPVSMTLTNGGAFDLNGANFGGNDYGNSNQFYGYRDGELVYSELFGTPYVGVGGSLQYHSFGWESVDRVEFSKAYNTEGIHVMDDLQYSVSAVPLPAAAGLFISAIAGLAGAKRLSRSKGSA